MSETATAWPSAFRRLELASVTSTNDEARKLAATGDYGPVWIRADEQTGGRGRGGRHWVSEPGNLYATLLLPVEAPASRLAELGFVACLAVHDLASSAIGTDQDLSLKWPNDVLLCGRKLSGILAETIVEGGSAANVVAIGCGVNLTTAPEATRYGATHLADHGVALAPSEALVSLAASFYHWLCIWDNGCNFFAIAATWTGRSKTIGADVTIDLSGSMLRGTFGGLARDGALILNRDDGSQLAIRAGDVVSITF